MPDPVLILGACAAAAVVAALALLVGGWPWKTPRPSLVSLASAAGVGIGFVGGACLLGFRPKFTLAEAEERLFLVVVPAVAIVEIVAACLHKTSWPWALRLAVAAVVLPLLLHDSIYVSNLAGPDSREWSDALTRNIYIGAAAGLATVWLLLSLLSKRPVGRAVPISLALSCAGAAVTIMLSGSASGGPLALPLAAALVWAAVASLVLKGPADTRGAVGVGVVGLFSLLVIGRFFASLTTTNAVLLFCAPLLGWLPEAPIVNRLKPWLRGGLRVALTAVPVAVALFLAQQKFVEDMAPPSKTPGTVEPSVDDYMNFGK